MSQQVLSTMEIQLRQILGMVNLLSNLANNATDTILSAEDLADTLMLLRINLNQTVALCRQGAQHKEEAIQPTQPTQPEQDITSPCGCPTPRMALAEKLWEQAQWKQMDNEPEMSFDRIGISRIGMILKREKELNKRRVEWRKEQQQLQQLVPRIRRTTTAIGDIDGCNQCLTGATRNYHYQAQDNSLPRGLGQQI